MKRFIISVVICCLGIVSFAFANTYDLSQISQVKLVTEYSDDTTVDQMDTVAFGSYPQSDASGNIKEPIEWIVLEKQDDKILLLSKNILDGGVYYNGKNLYKYNGILSWANSRLKDFANSDFYNSAFSNIEKNAILTTQIHTNDTNISYDGVGNSSYTKGGPDTNCKIFLLSKEEYFKYFNGIDRTDRDNSVKKCHKAISKPTLYVIQNSKIYISTTYDGTDAYYYYLRTPGYWKQWSNSGIGVDGKFVRELDYDDANEKYRHGFRPAMWVSLSTLTNNEIVTSNNNDYGSVITGLPSRESELRSDNHFYLDNSMQKSTWVYYKTYYYHVDGSGNIQKNQWIELRYVGADGRMYRGRQTPDGKWVGDDGLVVDTTADLSKSLTIEAAEPDSWYKTQSGLWYYFENDRTTTKKGWFNDSRDNQTYYLDPQTGIMAVGWTKINGSEYYFNESHDNENNWYETGGGFYESYGKKTKAYGSMFKNETTPDGKKVDVNGKLVK